MASFPVVVAQTTCGSGAQRAPGDDGPDRGQPRLDLGQIPDDRTTAKGPDRQQFPIWALAGVDRGEQGGGGWVAPAAGIRTGLLAVTASSAAWRPRSSPCRPIHEWPGGGRPG